MGFVDVVPGDAVLVTTLFALPDVLVVVEPELAIEIGSAAVAPPVDVGEALAHRVSPVPESSGFSSTSAALFSEAS